MIKCPCCGELITPNCTVYRASTGFVDTEGLYYEDASVLVHQECYYDYLYNPFDKLEEDYKNL